MATREHPYSLQFAIESTGVSSQTLRHWRQTVPSLQGRSGHKPCFSAGDLLALKVLQAWVTATGGLISHLRGPSTSLFELCGREPWPRIEQSMLVYCVERAEWELVPDGTPLRWPRGSVVLPIGQLARDLREQFMGPRDSAAQKTLEFPLMEISGETKARPTRSIEGGRQ